VRTGRTLVALVVVGTAAVIVPASASTVPTAAAAVAPELVIAEDFADPEVVEVDGVYHGYSTSSGRGRVPHATAPAPRGPWTIRGDVLPQKPSWAGDGGFWAPDVSRLADGRFLLYFTGPSVATGLMCIGAATAAAPDGPFTPTSDQPLVCNPAEGGDIDPSSFVDADGTRYLLYKNDGNHVGRPAIIWLQRTEADGVTFVGDRVELLRNDRPEDEGVIEAPVLVRRPTHYVLFFSAGVYTTGNYHTSYAVSGSLTGPYQRAYRPLITTATVDGAVNGPGGADLGTAEIFVHGWIEGGRGMYAADLGWANDFPVVRGSRVRYEAERGTLNNAAVRTGVPGASEGAVVGNIDHPDSWVEVATFAPTPGAYRLSITYAAGFGEAQHTLTVNGGAAQVVTYPNTGWDNWTQLAVDVTLDAGFNTIRLQHLTRWAELDHFEVA
jgi:arabinan endo-1,5-alpha-L-arabinosidase